MLKHARTRSLIARRDLWNEISQRLVMCRRKLRTSYVVGVGELYTALLVAVSDECESPVAQQLFF